MKPHIFKRGTFWWIKAPFRGKSITLHGTSPINAYLRYVLIRSI